LKSINTIEYWVSLLSRIGPKKIRKFRLKVTKKVTEMDAEDFCKQSIEHFNNIGINKNFIDKITELTEKIKIYGMEHSDVIIIIGTHN